MRKLIWVVCFVLFGMSTPVLRADTTYTINQTFNVNGGTISGCNSYYLGSQCAAATASITGTITTDGNTGALTSADITGFDLSYDYGYVSAQLGSGNGPIVGVTGSALYATATDLFFTTGSGAGSLSFTEGNGHSISESLTASGPAALDFYLSNYAPATAVSGSMALTGSTMTIGTAVAPEPSTGVLFLIGLGFIMLLSLFLAQKRRVPRSFMCAKP